MEEIIAQYIWIIGPVIILIIVFLIYQSSSAGNELKTVKATVLKLRQSFNDLDEQAKLIVKTDLELNRAQEELDKRLNGLESLQIISKSISTSLDQAEIFERLGQVLKNELPFERKAVFLIDENKALSCRINTNFPEQNISEITQNLQDDLDLLSALKDGKTYSSINSIKKRKESISTMFDVEHFILSPIMVRNEISGIVFVGNQTNTAPINEGDEEIISIMANQIGQSLENAKLFEQVFNSSQDLEEKVQDRTRRLEDALREVQNISKTKSEFISAVSHELRTPLTSIKGYASILMAGKLGDVPDQVKERLGKINMHSDNLVNLINDLLDISRIESGKIEMNIKEGSLLHIIETIHDLLTPQMKDKNIQCVIKYDERIPELAMDSGQIERVFINLVGNAVKFTPENGTITMRAKLENENLVQCEVSDNGIGIPEKDIVKLFDEFYRVSNTINEHVKGTGLGLPLAKKIVEAHDGEIWITSKMNEGTTFHFTIPIKKHKEEKR